MPDSENEEEDGNVAAVRTSHNTGHFAQALVLDQQTQNQEQMDPVDMITQLLNQNKTAGRDEIQALLYQHQRMSNLSKNNRDSQVSQNKPVRENIVFGRKRSPINGE